MTDRTAGAGPRRVHAALPTSSQRLRIAGERRPRVIGFNQIASGLPEGLALLGIPQQANHRVGKVSGIRGDEMATVLEREPSAPTVVDTPGLAIASASKSSTACRRRPERDNVDGRFANRRPHVVNRAQ